MLEWLNFKPGKGEGMPYQFKVKALYHSNLGGRLKPCPNIQMDAYR